MMKTEICEHEYIVEKTEDVPRVDFHKTQDGALSKRWKYSRCKNNGFI